MSRIDRDDALLPVEHEHRAVCDPGEISAERDGHRHSERAGDDSRVRGRRALGERDGDDASLPSSSSAISAGPEIVRDENRVHTRERPCRRPVGDACRAAAELAHVGCSRGEHRIRQSCQNAGVRLGGGKERFGGRQPRTELAHARGQRRILGHQAVRLQDLRLVGEARAAEPRGCAPELRRRFLERSQGGSQIGRRGARICLAEHERAPDGDPR